jgi:hypothetical protein
VSLSVNCAICISRIAAAWLKSQEVGRLSSSVTITKLARARAVSRVIAHCRCLVEIPGGGPIVFVGDHHQIACAHAHFASLVASWVPEASYSDGVSCRAPRAVLQACRLSRLRTPCTPHVESISRRRRYAQPNRHSPVVSISRRTSSQSSTDAVYSARRCAVAQ